MTMLSRQKLLLLLLGMAGRPVSRMELTAWCFLLRSEFASRGGSSFYDFVPCPNGPWSFALEHEAIKLAEQRYLLDVDGHSWIVNADLARGFGAADEAVENDARRLLKSFREKDAASVGDYVRNRYPAYLSQNYPHQCRGHQTEPPAVFTAGYEGLSIDRFLNLLIQSGVRRLIDVRNNPTARRYGFHKSTLQRLTRCVGIDYIHTPELGIPGEQRQNLDTQESYDALFERYEQSTLATERDSVQEVGRLAKEQPSVLVCMESKPSCCHRSKLAMAVAKNTKLPVKHLEEIC